MKATKTNMMEGEHDTERHNSKQDKDSDQPRQNKDLVPIGGATAVTWV